MKEGPDIARIAALIGDPARANMLAALMGGKALTATELAREAGVTPQTASSHLAKLCEGGLTGLRRQGRHKYFSLATDEIAHLLENLMGIAARSGHSRTRTGPRDEALRKARVCYNQLAGDLATQMYDSLIRNGHLHLDRNGIGLSPDGEGLMRKLGIDLDALRSQRVPLCRECLDWSERRAHLSGSLGRALLARFVAMGWASRSPDSRIVQFTPRGEARFRRAFAIGDA